MKRLVGIGIFLLVIAITCGAFATTATVIADALNLRESPQGTILGTVRYGEQVEVLNGPDRNGYYQISYKDSIYYVYGTYLYFGSDLPELPQIDEGENTHTQQQTTKGKGVNPKYYLFTPEIEPKPILFVNAKEISLRKYAEPLALRLGWVQKGDPLILVSTKITNGFVKVRTLDGSIEGYTFYKYLSTYPIKGYDYSDFKEDVIPDEGIITWTILDEALYEVLDEGDG